MLLQQEMAEYCFPLLVRTLELVLQFANMTVLY